MPSIERNELSVAELLGDTPSHAAGPVVLDPLIAELPIGEMPWADFEKLCARLLESTGNRVKQAYRYGASGQSQDGIDILATLRLSKRMVVMQCKRTGKARPQQIIDWVRSFFERDDLGEIEEYILAIACNVESDRKLVEAWRQARGLLTERHIEGTLWDVSSINTVLRSKHDIVRVFFGNDAAERFCATPFVVERYPSEFRIRYSNTCGNHVFLENRSVRLDMFLPTPGSGHVSAGLSFARTDLSGISFAVDGRTIVDWMQWRAHRSPGMLAPFLVHQHENKWTLMASSVRLSLEAEELEEFDWIILEAWQRYIQAAVKVEQEWQVVRFPRIEVQDDRFVFGLFRVRQWFWREILQYAIAHDCAKGSTESYIFDGAPGVLKVYVQQPRAGLNPGYHLIAFGYREGGIISPWDDDVIIGWEPLTRIGSENISYTPQDAFNAEYAHEWLLIKLFPRVLKWVESNVDRDKSTSAYTFEFPTFRRNRHSKAALMVDDYVVSLSEAKYRNKGLRFISVGEISSMAHTLQSHFCGYHSAVMVERNLIINLLTLIARFAHQAKKLDEYYLRSKLELGEGDVLAEIDRLNLSLDKIQPSAEYLDMSLRSLGSIIDDIEVLSQPELDVAAELLSPIWERYTEDRICRAYS